MKPTMKPKVLVSKCLGFDNCRYNGQTIPDDFIEKLSGFVDMVKVCPEVEIGLGVPRDPIRIALNNGGHVLYQPATKKDVTKKMRDFTKAFLDQLDVDGCIMKYKSPSCGPNNVKVYLSMDKDDWRYTKGHGFFGGEVLKKFSVVEDEGRLSNFSIREHFLTRLFMMARFRQVQDIGALVEFHTKHKLLLMAYNQNGLRQLGRIVASYDKKNLSKVLKSYKVLLEKYVAKMPSYRSMINVMLHAYGGISEMLSKNEKMFFLNTIEEYRDERIPFSVITHMIRSWAIRFDDKFLLEQALLEPYPLALVEVTDSGKGRKK